MKTLICALVAAAALAGPARAGDKPPIFVRTAAVPDKPGFAIDPAKAYVMLRGDMPVAMYLMRVPSAEDKATYEAFRMRGLAAARAKYPKKLKDYGDAMEAFNANGGEMPRKPIEPTEENFQVTPFEVLTAISIGPLYRFAKSKSGESTYLQELTPGEYRLYGPIVYTGAGLAGACYCMGSVKFEARAGEITDLGVILAKQSPMPLAPADDSSKPIELVPATFLGPAPAGMALDPRLASLPIRRAEFHPVGKLPNYFGIAVDRIPPIPGVIAYDRDRIVDLTATHAQ